MFLEQQNLSKTIAVFALILGFWRAQRKDQPYMGGKGGDEASEGGAGSEGRVQTNRDGNGVLVHILCVCFRALGCVWTR